MFKHCRIMKTYGSITAQTFSLSHSLTYLSATLDIFNRCRSNCACRNLIWKDKSGNSQGECMWVCVCKQVANTAINELKFAVFHTAAGKKNSQKVVSWSPGQAKLVRLISSESLKKCWSLFYRALHICHAEKKIDLVAMI